ncbi:MAG: repeat-containing protein [Actinobacteria bacterium]|nr:repeat-containing protein [Actinomycetota bacterium]
MKNQGRKGNLTRFVVWAALNVVLLIGCGGGGPGAGGVSGGGAGPSDSVAPAVVSSAPADGAIDVAVDASLEITFTEPVDPATVNGTTVKIRADGTEMAGTVGCVHDTITFTPAINWRFDTKYTVTISSGPSGVKDLAGNSLATDHTWTFTTGQGPDTTPPTIIVTNPVNRATGVPLATIITAAFSEPVTNVTETTFLLAADGVPVPGKVTVNGAMAMFTPSAPLAPPPYYGYYFLGVSVYQVTITTGVTDLSGNHLATEHTWAFTTHPNFDTTAPVVATTTPVEGSSGVPVGTFIIATFSEPVTNVTETTFLLTANGVPVPGKVTVNRLSAFFTPSAPLPTGASCTAMVTTGVRDFAGNPLATDCTWTFTTNQAADTTPPTVSSTTPVEGATGVPVGTSITAMFTEPVTNLSEATFLLAADGAPVSGKVTLNGPTATFTPSTPLSVGPTYRATITTGVKDLSGNASATDYNWSFTLSSSPWTVPFFQIGSDNAFSPKVAMDGRGQSIVVWVQSDGTANSIWASRYSITGFGEPAAALTLIETWVGQASSPQVAMDNSGNGVVVWVQSDGTADSIWSNRYVPGTGWGTATLIETGAGQASSPQVAMGNSGNATAVWVQSDGTADSIWSNRYVPGTGWGTATAVEAGAGKASSPQVAMNGGDNAVAVWIQFDGTADSIWSNRYVPGTGWGMPTLLETGPGNASSPQVAMDGSGNVIAVWVQSDGAIGSIWSNRYIPSSGWGTASPIEVRSVQASSPHVAIMNNYAVAVWEEWDGTRRNIRLSQSPMFSYGGCSIAGTGGDWKEGVSAYGVLILVAAGLAMRRFHRRLQMAEGVRG